MKKRRSFTLVELLVVIAILAILATVSILGYSSFVYKAKLINDKSYVAQVNLVLQASEYGVEFNVPSDIFSKTDVEEHKPESDGYFVYNANSNRLVLVDKDFNEVEGKLDSVASNNWVFISEVLETSYSIYLYEDYSSLEEINLSNRGIDFGSNSEEVTVKVLETSIVANGQHVEVGGKGTNGCKLYGTCELVFKEDSFFELEEGCTISKFATEEVGSEFKHIGHTNSGYHIWVKTDSNVINVYVSEVEDSSSATKITEDNKDSYDANIRQLYEDMKAKTPIVSFADQVGNEAITIGKDENIKLTKALTIEKNTIINLNGYDLEIDKPIKINKNVTLTINGKGKLTILTTANYAIELNGGGYDKATLIIGGANLELQSAKSGILVEGISELYMESGNIKHNSSTTEKDLVDGTIKLGHANALLYISGGEISQSNDKVYVLAGVSNSKNKDFGNCLVIGKIHSDVKGIIGGKFTVDPTEHLKKDYQATKTDDVWIVSSTN